jgi:hypothetical protein
MLKSINKQLNEGKLPTEFYDMIYPQQKENINIDWNKVQYNSFYKSYDYFDGRFKCDYSHIQGFDKVIEEIAKNNSHKTPLDEILERQEEKSNTTLINDDK